MRYFKSSMLFLFVLLALMAPSMAALAREVIPAPEAVSVAPMQAGAGVYRPCQKQGGKRVLPCHADIGILRAARRYNVWPRTPTYFLEQARAGMTPLLEVATPPPRT